MTSILHAITSSRHSSPLAKDIITFTTSFLWTTGMLSSGTNTIPRNGLFGLAKSWVLLVISRRVRWVMSRARAYDVD